MQLGKRSRKQAPFLLEFVDPWVMPLRVLLEWVPILRPLSPCPPWMNTHLVGGYSLLQEVRRTKVETEKKGRPHVSIAPPLLLTKVEIEWNEKRRNGRNGWAYSYTLWRWNSPVGSHIPSQKCFKPQVHVLKHRRPSHLTFVAGDEDHSCWGNPGHTKDEAHDINHRTSKNTNQTIIIDQ